MTNATKLHIILGMGLIKIINTPARSAIREFLSTVESPVDVEQIIAFLRSRKLNTNKVTVYRTLDFLFKNGIADRLEFQEGKFRYEIKKMDHHHLICTNCRRVGDIADSFIKKFEEEIKKKRSFLVKNHALEFFGICKNCQS